MRKKTLDGLLKLADWQATLSSHQLQEQRDHHNQALKEQATVQQYIATYDNIIAGDEYSPALLAHKRLFVSRLSEQLTQLGKHVVDCGNRVDQAGIDHRADTQKVVALQLLRDGEVSRVNLKTRRSEQMEQDEVASRPPFSGCASATLQGADHA